MLWLNFSLYSFPRWCFLTVLSRGVKCFPTSLNDGIHCAACELGVKDLFQRRGHISHHQKNNQQQHNANPSKPISAHEPFLKRKSHQDLCSLYTFSSDCKLIINKCELRAVLEDASVLYYRPGFYSRNLSYSPSYSILPEVLTYLTCWAYASKVRPSYSGWSLWPEYASC